MHYDNQHDHIKYLLIPVLQKR